MSNRLARGYALMGALLAFVLVPGNAAGQVTNWTNPGAGNWFTAGNWDNGVPIAGSDPHLNLGTAAISLPGAVADEVALGIGAGNGNLLIFLGTLNQTGNSYIGRDAGSNSIVTVRDLGSFWNTNSIILGGAVSSVPGGNGTMNVQLGGRVDSLTSYIAFGTPSTGSATVDGAGSTWNVVGDLNTGYSGSGSLLVSTGGLLDVSGGSSYIGFSSGSNGMVTVSDTNSLWRNTRTVYVGGQGTAGNGLNGAGSLQVLSGGRVDAAHLQVFDTGVANINNGSSTVSGLTISGGAAPAAITSPLGPLNVGNTASGRMVVQTGGTVSNSVGTIGASPGTIGSVLVQNAGSTWNNTDNVVVGLSGSGMLEVRNGGTLTSVRGFAGANAFSTGLITVSDPGSTWTASGSLFIGNSGTGGLEVLNGGFVSTAGNSHLGITVGATGDVNVSGAGSTWNTALELNIGGDSASAQGTGFVRIADGGTVNVGVETNLYSTGRLDLVNATTYTGDLNTFGGLIRTFGITTLANPVHLNTGGVSVENNTAAGNSIFSGNIDGVGGLTKSTVIGVTGQGALILTGNNSYAGLTTVSAGRLLVNGTHSGGGNYTIAPTAAGVDATLGGTGTIGPLLAARTVALTGANLSGIDTRAILNPGGLGASVGTLTVGTAGVNTAVNFGNLSRFAVDVDGATADRLTINGSLTLGSSTTDGLVFNVINAPTAGRYTLLSYTGSKTDAGTTGFTTASGVPIGYRLSYDNFAASNGLIELVQQAVIQPTATPTNATIITGGTTPVTVTVTNGVQLLGDTLNSFTASAGVNVTGAAAGGGPLAAQASSGPVGSFLFNGAAIGLTAGSVSVSSTDAGVPTPVAGNFNVTVLDHSNAEFDNVSGAASSVIGSNSLVLNFGNVPVGAGGGFLDSFFDVFAEVATPGLTAGLDLDLIGPGAGDVATLFRQAGPTTFTALDDGTGQNYAFRFDTSSPGTFLATYPFLLSDENLPGGTAFGSEMLMLTLQGTVLAEPLPAVFPEPSSIAAWLIGAAAIGFFAYRRRRKAAYNGLAKRENHRRARRAILHTEGLQSPN